MASQISRERIFGNFKPDRRADNSQRHLALIRLLPCCVTGLPGPNDPHHLKCDLAHERGAGRRAADRHAVPLCRAKHDQLERLGSRNERDWFEAHGIDDPVQLAADLWRATGDLDAMTAIVRRALI